MPNIKGGSVKGNSLRKSLLNIKKHSHKVEPHKDVSKSVREFREHSLSQFIHNYDIDDD